MFKMRNNERYIRSIALNYYNSCLFRHRELCLISESHFHYCRAVALAHSKNLCAAKNQQSNSNTIFQQENDIQLLSHKGESLNTTTDANQTQNTNVAQTLNVHSEQQMTFHDQRVVKQENALVDVNEIMLQDRSSTICSEPVDNLGILKQPLAVATFNWGTAQAAGSILNTIQVPFFLSSLPNYHQMILQMYTFLKFTARFEVKVNSTIFHQGKLIVWWDPMAMTTNSNATQVAEKERNVYRASGNPNVLVDAGNSNTGVIDIPFEHIVSCINSNSSETSQIPLGKLFITVLNPLNAGANVSPNVGVTVFFSAPDVELFVPTRPHTLQFGTLIPNMLDKHDVDAKGKGNMLATVSPLAHMVGQDPSVRLGVHEFGMYEPGVISGASNNETDIKTIITKKMLFDIFTWSSATTANSILASYKVRPGITGSNLGLRGGAGQNFVVETPTFVSYMEKFFAQWRGSMVFRFDFTCSQIHSGRILCVFEPTTTPTPITKDVTVNQYSQNPSIVFDLRESKTFTVLVPYTSNKHRLKTSDAYHTVTTDPYDERYCSGTLTLFILDPLVVTAATATTINVNAYASAGPDMQFFVPRMLSSKTLLGKDYVIPTGQLLANGKEIDDVKTRSEDDVLGHPIMKGNQMLSKCDFYKEDITNVMELTKRYNKIVTAGIPFQSTYTGPDGLIQNYGTFSISTTPTPDVTTNSATIVSGRSFLTMMSKLFVFWSGSLRYKFVNNVSRFQPCVMTAVYTVQTPLVGGDPTNPAPAKTNVNPPSWPATTQNLAQDCSIEVEAPFNSVYSQHLCSTAGGYLPSTDAAIYNTGYVNIAILTTDEASFPANAQGVHAVPTDVYQAGGNDLMFRYLIAPPNISAPISSL
nr:MAG: non-structural polyprotein [Avian associated picorna-like virus 8]